MSFIKPIQLGPIKLHSNLVQGPLAGYSCAPFRVLTWRYGKPGFCATEMISAKDLINRKHKPKRYLGRDPQEGTLCYQLAADDPEILAKASQLVSAHGADIIDLNCGCPVTKVRSKGTGSRLLAKPEKIYQLVRAMKTNTEAAISIKIRVAADAKDHDNFAVIDAAESAGVDFITVHGRHWTERYDVPCRFDEIAAVVKKAKVPIFANGDVEDTISLKQIFESTQCAGVMIARAGVGQPWLFEKLTAELQGKTFVMPSFEEIGTMFLNHIDGLIQLMDEKRAILQSRKLAKYYARTLTHKRDFIIAMQQANIRIDVENIIQEYTME